MTTKTHMSVGVAVAMAIIMTSSYNIVYVIIACMGAIAPDFDIKLGIKHRTWTHSILLLGLTTWLFSTINLEIAIFWAIGYATHLIIDSFTKRGVPFFYPIIKKKIGFKLCTTGKTADKVVGKLGKIIIIICSIKMLYNYVIKFF